MVSKFINKEAKERVLKEAASAGIRFLRRTSDPNRHVYEVIKCKHSATLEPGNVRALRAKYTCKICAEIELATIASSHGYKLIRKRPSSMSYGKARNYCRIKFLDCNHIDNVRVDGVKKGNAECGICKDKSIKKKLKTEAKEAGLLLVGESKDHRRRKYKWVSCGHEEELKTGHVRDKSVRCSTCLERLFSKQATMAGLILLGKTEDDRPARRYKYLSCGHVQEILLSSVRQAINKNILIGNCTSCMELRHASDARNCGLKLLGSAIDRHKRPALYRSYKKISCGHIADYQVSNVRGGAANCEICEESSLGKPSEIYLLRLSNSEASWLKLGFSNNISKRVKEYGLPKGTKIEIVLTRRFRLGQKAREAEQGLHLSFRKKRLPPQKMKKFHSRGGFAECYPLSLERKLIEAING
jgi:hypothetical protein